MSARRQHPAEHRQTEEHSSVRPAPVASTNGTTPRMKAKAVMRMGRSRSLGPCQGRVDERLALLILDLRKLHDKNGVLGGQSDEHHQADLSEHIVLTRLQEPPA